MNDRDGAVRGDVFVGLDLGKLQDHSAIVILEQLEDEAGVVHYDARYISKLSLHLNYEAQIRHVVGLCRDPRLGSWVELVFDRSGVGAAVAEMLEREIGYSDRIALRAVVLHGGYTTQRTADGSFGVPKQDLVAAGQLVVSAGRLHLPPGRSSQVLIDELLAFRVVVHESGHESFSSPSGKHDDVLIALLLALWYAETIGAHYTGIYV